MAFKLWIDEGHGGADSGAAGGGKLEDSRNLTLGEECERIARAQGWAVDSTREKDIFVTLQNRYREANAYHADAFVSIHHDWKQGEQAVIFADRHDAKSSKRLADSINDELVDVAKGIPNGGIYGDRRGLAVLNGTNMPAVIVEASRVQDAYKVAEMAKAIVRGICHYKGIKFVDPDAAPAPKPEPKPAPAKPKKHPVLSEGDTGADVEALQLYLIRKGYSVGRDRADGDFGPNTKRAVRAYQIKRLPRFIGGASQWDGIVGPNTWAKIDANK